MSLQAIVVICAHLAARITQIQNATNATVMARERVDIGVENTCEAGRLMDGSIQSLEEYVGYAPQILLGSKQRTIGINQITLAGNLNDVVKTGDDGYHPNAKSRRFGFEPHP